MSPQPTLLTTMKTTFGSDRALDRSPPDGLSGTSPYHVGKVPRHQDGLSPNAGIMRTRSLPSLCSARSERAATSGTVDRWAYGFHGSMFFSLSGSELGLLVFGGGRGPCTLGVLAGRYLRRTPEVSRAIACSREHYSE